MIQRVRISVVVGDDDDDSKLEKAATRAPEKLSRICAIFPYLFSLDLASSGLQATHLRSLRLVTELCTISFPKQCNEEWIKVT